jgi:hypothetical protein
MQERALYRKRGSRYEQIGYDFIGFPSNGVWYVADGTQSLMMKVGDLLDPAPLAALMQYKQVACNAVSEVIAGNPGRGVSVSQMVDIAFKAVCQAVEQEPKQEERPLTRDEVQKLRGVIARTSIKGPSKPSWEMEQQRVKEQAYQKLAQAGYGRDRELNGHEL